MNQIVGQHKEPLGIERPWAIIAVWTLRAVLAMTAAVEVWSGHLLYAGEALLALALCSLSPALLRVDRGPSPMDVEIILLMMAIGNCTLGVAFNLYRTLPYYDKFLHLINPVALAFYCIIFLQVLTDSRRPLVSSLALAVIAALVILGTSAIWEILEYLSDVVVGSETQGTPTMSPLDDTMWDLLLGLLGSLMGAVAGGLSWTRGAHATESRAGL